MSVSHDVSINGTINFIFPALNVGVRVLRILFHVSSLAWSWLHEFKVIAEVWKILDHNLFEQPRICNNQ